MSVERNQLWEAFKDITSGTVGGIAQVVAGHPLDTVKVRLQSMVVEPNKPPPFTGTIDCFRKTVLLEGFSGLYKGALSPLAGAMVLNAAIFFAYGQSKFMVSQVSGRAKNEMTLGDHFIAGALTGGFISPIEAPVDLLKCKLQAQVGNTGHKYTGVWDCAKQLYRHRGIPAIFQGWGATALRDIPCFGAYFYFFELTRRLFTPPEKEPPLWVNFLAGGSAGFGFWGLLYPLDIIKTKIQIDATDYADRKYKGYLDCVRQILREGGVAALFKGYNPALLRAIPLNASIFLAVLSTKKFVYGN